jgi:sporulation protein YlmC with PRC-barrel domain
VATTTGKEVEMRTLEDVKTWRGMTMVDANGEKIGTIEDIYLDRQTGEPEWASVKTGLFGLKSSFVPISAAEPTGEDQVRVPFHKDQVKDAPKVEADGELSADEERRLYEYYGRSDYDEWRGDDRTAALGLAADREGRFQRPGEADVEPGADMPPVVGVRLRRFVVVTGAPDIPATGPGDPAGGRAPGEVRDQ